jgi:arylsulfatase A-like enzyme
MNKRLIAFLLLVSFTGVIFAEETHSKRLPNFLVVLSDDHSAPFVGAYGDTNAVTPNLDKFASEGIIFRRAYVSCPQCVPSRAGIFASRSPVGIGMSRFSAAFPANVKTFPEYLREKGYFTGLAGRTYHQEGYNGKGDPVRNESGELEYRRFADRFDYAKSGNSLAQLAEFLDNVPQGKPFYLQLCFSDPHRPYDGQNIPNPRDPEKLVLPSWFPDTPELRKDLAAYYDEINRFDRDFGKVLAELEQRSLKENTLIIFLGDNGGATLRGKGTLYEFGIHVPFIVRWANHIKSGTNSSALISAEDIGSTLLDAAGIKPPKEFTGQSFLPVLRAKEDAPQRKYIFSERGPHGSGLPNNSAAFDLGRTIVGQRYKLIYNATWQIPYYPVDFAGLPFWKEIQEAAQNGTIKVPEPLIPYFAGNSRNIFELYDLQDDPNELNNLAGNPAFHEVETQLKQDLTEWMILERDFIPLPSPPQKNKKNNNNRNQNNIVPETTPGIKLLFDFSKELHPIADASGKNNIVTVEGDIRFVMKDNFSARYFNGNSYIDVERSSALHSAETPWSVEATVRSEQPSGVILAYGGTGNGYSLFLENGKPGFAVRTDREVFTVLAEKTENENTAENRVTIKGVITPDKKAELYVNGQKSAFVVLPRFIAGNPVESLQIGTDLGGKVNDLSLPNFKGWIERVEIKRLSF